jgi:BASS family bile acid:Na+ symporter
MVGWQAKETTNMERNPSHLGWISSLVQRHYLLLLLAAYAAAAMAPSVGMAAGDVTLGCIPVLQGPVRITLPMLLLAGLLLSAGLGADTSELAQLVRKPHIVCAGLLMNLLVPVGFLALLFQALRLWHNPEETQNLMLGLALVAAMPVAGSSTAWAQNANGNMALSLGLVILSTLLSPVTTPLILTALGLMATGGYAELLHGLSGSRTGAFLLLCVVVPAFSGLMIRRHLGKQRTTWLRPKMKFFNALVLLFLCYTNAAGSLPEVLGQPDWDFLVMVFTGVTGLCLAAFAAGWVLARVLQVDQSQQRSLMFGLGMNNNGTGLVLASTSLAALPSAILPVLVYNLVQHLVACGVQRVLDRASMDQAR